MDQHISIGKVLFHKYLGDVSVVQISDDRIKADTGSRGILDFAFFDIGKVLFFEKSHASNYFTTYDEYLQFCKEERLKHKREAKAEKERKKRIYNLMEQLEAERLESEKLEAYKINLEKLRRIEIIEEERNKNVQNNNILIINSAKNQYEQLLLDLTYDYNSLFEEYSPKKDSLLNIKIEQNNKIKEIIERRKINHLVHFTRIENLNSILENGIIPVSIQAKKGIQSIHNDENRIDNRLDCTSLSVSYLTTSYFLSLKTTNLTGRHG